MEQIKKINCNFLSRTIVIATSVALLLFGMLFDEVNQFLAGGVLVVGAIGVYFLAVFKTCDKNYLSFSAVFNAVWIATIGLSQLRLLGYQKIWNDRTWLNLILATVMFQIAIPIGHFIADKFSDKIYSRKSIGKGKIKFEFKQQRLFWICLIATGIAVALFIWNIFVKGYVPFFSTIFNAYAYFYTKRMIFVTAACATSPIAYWCIKKCNLSVFKKILMYLCIAINTFIIPILQVNRGVFIVAALMLTAAIFYLNGKKFLVMVVCLVVVFGFYEMASVARNYTDEYLNNIFEPVQFAPGDSSSTSSNTSSGDTSSNDTSSGDTSSGDTSSGVTSGDSSDGQGGSGENNKLTFKLPAKVSFLYGYFTVSHDNFNEAVNNATKYSYGIRQLTPFNVILRSQFIYDAMADAEYYTVKYDLNTTNLISGVYYDLREFGVIIFTLLWGLALGIIEKIYLKHKGVFALAALGNALTPVVLPFFTSWFENFTLWLFWGTIMLIMFFSSINISNKKNME